MSFHTAPRKIIILHTKRFVIVRQVLAFIFWDV